MRPPQTTGYGCLSIYPQHCHLPHYAHHRHALCRKEPSAPRLAQFRSHFVDYLQERRFLLFNESLGSTVDALGNTYLQVIHIKDSSWFGGAYLLTSRIPHALVPLPILLPFYRDRPSRVTFKLTVKFLFCSIHVHGPRLTYTPPPRRCLRRTRLSLPSLPQLHPKPLAQAQSQPSVPSLPS